MDRVRRADPVGRYGGALAAVRPDDMAATVLRAVVERAPLDPALVEDVILGCANQAGEDNRDVARMAVLLAGFPVEVGGLTVNRLCGSGLQAINSAAHAIEVGDGDVFIGGGVESMTRAPYVMAKPESAWDRGPRELQDTTLGWRFVNPKLAEHYYPYSMGETAENVAERWGVSRERQDAFALESHRRAVAAIEDGRFDGQLVPVEVPQRKGDPVVVARDEHPRADTTLEALAKLRPAFAADGGSVTAGNASGINDGASAVLLVEAERARELGLHPMARVVSTAVAGVDPVGHGHRPDPGVTQGARAGRHRRRGPRPHRAQRGVRLAVAGLHRRARARSREGERERWGDRARPSARDERRAPRDDARPRAVPDRRALRPRDDVHRGRPGDRDRHRTDRRLGVSARNTVPRRTSPTPTATSTSDWVTRSALSAS